MFAFSCARQVPGTKALVEVDRVPVPIEHSPLEAPAPAPCRFLRAVEEECVPNLFAPVLRQYKQVLKVERGQGQERRVGLEYEGVPGHLALALGQENLEAGSRPKSVSQEAGLRGFVRGRQLLEVRQRGNQAHDCRAILRRGAAYRHTRHTGNACTL